METRSKTLVRTSKLGSRLATLGCAGVLLALSGVAHAMVERGGITGPLIQRAVQARNLQFSPWQQKKALAFSHMGPRQRFMTQKALRSPYPGVRAWGIKNVLRNAYVGPR